MAMTSALFGDLLDRAIAMRELGKSCTYIKRVLKIDLSVGAIEWQLMRAGIYHPKTRPPGLYRRTQSVKRGSQLIRPYRLEEDIRLLSMEAAGVPIVRIARALGRGNSSVRGRLLTLARYEAEGMLPTALQAASAGEAAE